MMADWTFRVSAEPFSLTSEECREIEAEIRRLRALMGLFTAVSPDARQVRVRRNPSGPLGEYASLLMEATVRGLASMEILPADVRQQYHQRHWFAVSLDALSGFSDALAAARVEA